MHGAKGKNICKLIKGNEDIWKVELLENILYTINNNLSTTEVAQNENSFRRI